MRSPTVSMGVPVYNGERYLAETLESLLSQTFADFELILCDNASTDGTADICRHYAARDARVRHLPADVNRGAAWNYNRALAAARGRYFKWAAHDDLCAPTYLERCVATLENAPSSVVLAYPKTVLIDGDGCFLGPYEDGLDLRQPEPHERLRVLIRNLVMSDPVFGLMRVDALRRTRGHGSYISADYVLLAELALLGEFWEIPEPLFLRRIHQAMSRRANRSPSALAEWFETGGSRSRRREFVPLFAEYLVALRRAPDLDSRERLRVYATAVPWLRRFGKRMANELGLRLFRFHSPASPVTRPGRPEPVALRARVTDTLRSIAPQRAEDVELRIDPRLVVETDAATLDRILVSLLSNAVRHGAVPIAVAAEAGPPELTLTVDDHGPGVAPELLPRLFEPFARDGGHGGASPGLGLGLAIARMSAEMSGGTLAYEPAHPGARFRLTLPQAASSRRP